MAKLLLFLLVIGGIYFIVRAANRRAKLRAMQHPAEPEVMVRCDQCGIYLPRMEALTAGDRHYCCEEHKRSGGDA